MTEIYSAGRCEGVSSEPGEPRGCATATRRSVKAKFHYAIWSQTGSKQVRSWSQTRSELEFGLSSGSLQRTSTSFGPVCDEDKDKKGKGFPYSTPSVGPGADPGVQAVSLQVTVCHPPGGRLPLLPARPAVTSPAAEHHRPLAGTKLYCLVREAHRCKQLA